jgi:hypothetical protein
MRADAVPALIAHAGELAVLAYREFLYDPVRTPGTRKNYASYARRFFRWAESRGLSLEAIDAPALAAYAAEIAAAMLPVSIHLTPVRGVLGHLARSGVLPADPCPPGLPNGRGAGAPIHAAAPSIPLSELKRTVLEIGERDGWEEGDQDFQAGLVLLAPASIGTMDPAAVSRFTGVPEAQVREYADRLIANRIWRADGTIALSSDEDLALMMDVWVATGHLERTWVPDDEAPPPADPRPEYHQTDEPPEVPDAR